jgi:L-cysteine S-thiosulfotransferase
MMKRMAAASILAGLVSLMVSGCHTVLRDDSHDVSHDASRRQAQAVSPLPAVPSMPAALDKPLTSQPGDPQRGRAIVANRQAGLCLLCHAAPIPEERFQGNLGPDLAGSGSRWTEGQLRLRITDASALNPATIMPSYGTTEGLHRVNRAFQGKSLLDPQQIEDVVAYLRTLK